MKKEGGAAISALALAGLYIIMCSRCIVLAIMTKNDIFLAVLGYLIKVPFDI